MIDKGADLRDISKSKRVANCIGNAPHEFVDTGSFQRIADACELMAKSHKQLIGDRDRYKRWYEELRYRLESEERHSRALRGVITKLKCRLAEAKLSNSPRGD